MSVSRFEFQTSRVIDQVPMDRTAQLYLSQYTKCHDESRTAASQRYKLRRFISREWNKNY